MDRTTAKYTCSFAASMPTSNADWDSSGPLGGTEASVDDSKTFSSATPKSAVDSASIVKDEGFVLKLEIFPNPRLVNRMGKEQLEILKTFNASISITDSDLSCCTSTGDVCSINEHCKLNVTGKPTPLRNCILATVEKMSFCHRRNFSKRNHNWSNN